jgi:hypothetical protein
MVRRSSFTLVRGLCRCFCPTSRIAPHSASAKGWMLWPRRRSRSFAVFRPSMVRPARARQDLHPGSRAASHPHLCDRWHLCAGDDLGWRDDRRCRASGRRDGQACQYGFLSCVPGILPRVSAGSSLGFSPSRGGAGRRSTHIRIHRHMSSIRTGKLIECRSDRFDVAFGGLKVQTGPCSEPGETAIKRRPVMRSMASLGNTLSNTVI